MKIFMTVLTAFSAVLSLFLCGCGEQPSAADGKIRVTAGLPPVAYIAKKIAGERISVQTMLPEGKSPHDYAPGPRDVRNASGAKLFLSTGLPFEVRAVKPLQSVKIVDVTKNAAKIPFGGDHEHGPGCIHDHDDHTGHHHEAMDPHIWLDFDNIAKMAKIITAEFSAIDPAGIAVFEKNCAALLAEIAAADNRIKAKLAPYKDREFFVYHAAFGYFAHRYHLKQTAIELGAEKSPPHVWRKSSARHANPTPGSSLFSRSSTRQVPKHLPMPSAEKFLRLIRLPETLLKISKIWRTQSVPHSQER